MDGYGFGQGGNPLALYRLLARISPQLPQVEHGEAKQLGRLLLEHPKV